MTFEEKLKKYCFTYSFKENQIILTNTFTNLEYKFNTFDQIQNFLDGFESGQKSNLFVCCANHIKSTYYPGTGYPGAWVYFIEDNGVQLVIANIQELVVTKAVSIHPYLVGT